MKKILGFVVLAVSALLFYIHYKSAGALVSVDRLSGAQVSSMTSLSTNSSIISQSSADAHSAFAEGVSAARSSPKSLSGVRVDPLPEIVHFLRQMDNANIPKIYLPTPRPNLQFDYGKAKPAELKKQALMGDPYASYHYADYIVKQYVRTTTDKGNYVYEVDAKKRDLAMSEAREFYIRGFQGGIKSIANVLSKLYENPAQGGSRIESLAWRRISFAVGESERYNCLRDSRDCVVKDFNNLNRLENFYPCLSSDGESCAQEEYDAAMLLAFQYADSLEFAITNKVTR